MDEHRRSESVTMSRIEVPRKKEISCAAKGRVDDEGAVRVDGADMPVWWKEFSQQRE